MSFYGAIVKPGRPVPFVPPAQEDWNLHLSQAALPPTVKAGTRVALAISHGDGEEPIILCTLTAGQCDTANLDIFLSQVCGRGRGAQLRCTRPRAVLRYMVAAAVAKQQYFSLCFPPSPFVPTTSEGGRGKGGSAEAAAAVGEPRERLLPHPPTTSTMHLTPARPYCCTVAIHVSCLLAVVRRVLDHWRRCSRARVGLLLSGLAVRGGRQR